MLTVLELLGGTQEQCAALIGLSQAQVSRLLNAKSSINPTAAIAIEHATLGKVPRSTWPIYQRKKADD